MGQDVQLPNWAKQGPAQAFRGVNPFDDLLSEGIGRSYGIIGYKGKVWTLRVNGKVHYFTRADDGTQAPYIDVVILGQLKNKARSYYPKTDGYEDGGHARPVCASINGVVPDAGVQQQQNANCALCPRAVRPAGGGQSECTQYKRLAVFLMPEQTQRILGTALAEPVFLRVPPDSLKNLAAMGDMMAAAQFNYWSYFTRISFDPVKPHPCMLFEAKGGVPDSMAPLIIEMRKDPLVARITGGDALVVTGYTLTNSGPKQLVATPPDPKPITLSNGSTGNGFLFLDNEEGDAPVPPPVKVAPEPLVVGPHLTATDVDNRIAAIKGAPTEASDALAERIARLTKKKS